MQEVIDFALPMLLSKISILRHRVMIEEAYLDRERRSWVMFVMNSTSYGTGLLGIMCTNWQHSCQKSSPLHPEKQSYNRHCTFLTQF